MKKRKMIKQRWIVLAVILLALLVALGALYLWQQENVKAAANARKYSEQQLREQLEESRKTVETAVEQLPELTVRVPTEAERHALREGKLTPEELVAALTAPSGEAAAPPDAPAPTESPAPQTPTETPTQPSAAPVPVTPAPTPPVPTETPSPEALYQAALSEQVARVYVLREEFTAKLEELMAQGKAEYRAMPESERTKAKLASWASGYVSKASELEKQCDAEMDRIIADTRALIRANNGDLSLLKTLAYSYAQEKSIQKSIYIQELEKRGIM